MAWEDLGMDGARREQGKEGKVGRDSVGGAREAR